MSAGNVTTDLFGDPPQKPMRGGYAGRPGEGPKGETCGSYRHSFRTGRRNTRYYWKCGHARGRGDTSCVASDIRMGSPACQYWEGA